MKIIIIGSGPAGYTAAIYATRFGLPTILIAGMQVGGQLTTTHLIENFPGFPEPISGWDLTDKMRIQAEKFGCEIVYQTVTGVDFSDTNNKKVYLDNDTVLESSVVIIATGARAKYLGLESEQKYQGAGVSACAVCDGMFYKNADVIVVGGGDSAVGEALYLSTICKKVYLAVRRDVLRASEILVNRINNTPNIEILYKTNIKEIYGQGVVEGVEVETAGEVRKIALAGYFAAVGREPQIDFLNNAVELDKNGYIKVFDNLTKTSVDGVFACGDCADPVYRQAVVAAATGCKAAFDAKHYLETK